MGSLSDRLKSFWEMYTEIPANIPPEYKRFYPIFYYGGQVGFLMHFSWIFFFYYIAVIEMSIINILSSLFYLTYLIKMRKGFYHIINLIMTIVGIEVILHAMAAVHFVGWNYGFQYFVLFITVAIFMTPKSTNLFRFVFTFLTLSSFMFMWYYSQNTSYAAPANPLAVIVCNTLNIIGLFFTIALLVFLLDGFFKISDSALRSQTAELAEANEKLQELDKVKSNFFANISHEIRTPLTMILSPVESVIQGDYGKKIDKKFFENLQRNAIRLLKLINNLLDFSKIEAGRMNMKVQEADIVPFVRTYVGTVHSAA